MSLSVSNLINVQVNLSPTAAVARSFNILMIAGDSNVISGLQRFRTYSSLQQVAADFGTTAPEYLAADLYFEQAPTPATLMVGRWISTATAAMNEGGIIPPSQQAISNWTAIAAGSFVISMNGTPLTLTNLNFTGVTNLNGVASIITTALSGSAGSSCVWTGTNFEVISGVTGAGTQATGTVTFGSNPANNDTITVNGLTITFVSATPTGNQVLIGASANQTAANFQVFLQGSSSADLTVATYATALGVTTITYGAVGVAGNSFSLTKSSSAITLSGSTLTGGVVASSVGYATTAGSGTDISALLALTASTSLALVPGYNVETEVACVNALANLSTAWYGVMFSSTVSGGNSQSLAVSSFVQGLVPTRIHGVSSQDANCTSALSTNDIAYLMQQAGYSRSFVQYSSTTAHVVASLFGRMFSVDFTAQNSTINLMYKQEPGVVPETLTQTQAAALQAKNCNVFVSYDNGTSIIQYGVVSSGAYLDEIQGLDWLQNDIQTNVYNVLYEAPTKIPQTDSGVNQLVNAINQACNDGVNNGLIAPGIWNSSATFGTLQTGQFLKSGYYVYAEPVALQSESDRQTRAAPPIQVAVKLAGAIQSSNVIVDVNR